jgi:non-specific serine/threonine protein kinase
LSNVALQLQQVAAALPSYEIGEELARGSTGVVLAARHRQLGRDVAVKMLPPHLAENPDVRERFVAEAKLLASFSHVHIVPVYDYVEQDGLCLLVMERLGGGTLDDRARAGLDPPSSCAAVLAVCSGLHYAHDRGVLHRDVKPANVLVAADGLVKVTDFGIAKVLGGTESPMTSSGFLLGTPAYMAPEQARSIDTSPATDVYGAGTVLYELIAGRLPFPADNDPLRVLYSRLHSDPHPLQEAAPHVPPQLAEVVMRALEREPADRYESADEFGAAIAAAAADVWGVDWIRATPFAAATPGAVRTAASPTPGSVPETVIDHGGSGNGAGGPPPPTTVPKGVPSPEPPPERPGRRRIGLILGVVALVAAVALAAVLLTGGDDNKGKADEVAVKPTPNTAPASGWRELQPADTPRQQAPGAIVAGTAWVVGGLTDGPQGTPVATRTVEGFDTAIGQWKTGPELPIPLHHAMAANYKGTLVVMGGWIPKGPDLSATTSNRVFALRGGRWVELPHMRSPRAAGAAATVGDKLVVAGGQANDRLVPGVEVFDGKQWTPATDIPTPREHVAAASDGNFMYVVGGRDLDPDKNSAALERFDPSSDTWEKLPDMPTPLGGLGAAIVEGRLLAVGGETSTDVLDTALAYDIARRKWSKAPSLRTPRHGMAVVSFGNTVYALEGARKAGHTESTPIAEALSFVKRGQG